MKTCTKDASSSFGFTWRAVVPGGLEQGGISLAVESAQERVGAPLTPMQR